MTDVVTILVISTVAAIASPIGGAISLWRKPTTLFMSASLGFASGVLLATISFEMLPQALDLFSLYGAVGGFVAGFVAIYGFDLFIYRGQIAGDDSDQHPQVERFYQARRPRGGEVTVLAGGTTAEELIEGLSIGVGMAIGPSLGLLVALAIIIDNISEGLSIGEVIVAEHRPGLIHRVVGWTSAIGVALLASALAGWFFLRGLPPPILGGLFAVGAGAMFYLTISDLVPQAAERQYQQSSTIAAAAGFIVTFILAQYL